jgi:hypothetical protein
MRKLRILAAMLVAGLLLTTVAALPAMAGTRVTADVRPRSSFRLTVTHGEKPDPATAKTATLTCEPAGGTHPDPKTACAQLAAVNGDFGALNVNPGPCFLIFDPYTVTATGYWRGTPVNFQRTYANSCILGRQTGAVFAF